jgi:tetratricopeptide (TPR) repeat protein
LREVEVLSKGSQQKNIDRYLEQEFKETTVERVERVIEEYQVLGDYKYGEKLYQSLINKNPSNVEIKYGYAIYCIQNKLKKAEDVLGYVEDYLSYNKDDLMVRREYLLLLVASESEQNCKKAWVLLRELIETNPEDISNLFLASFIFSEGLGMKKVGEKFALMAERTQLKQTGKAPEDGKHNENPAASELPTAKALPSYN